MAAIVAAFMISSLSGLAMCPTSTPIGSRCSRQRELAQVANQSVDWIMLKPLRAEALREAMQHRPPP